MACLRTISLMFGGMALISGCYTVELSETTHPEDRIRLRGGPGARQGELMRIVRLKQKHYSGERVSFGIFPGVPSMANDFGDWSGYIPATALEVIVGPFVNAFALATPTLCTIFVEPFTKTSEDRGAKWDVFALGFVGAYRWRTLPHDETEIESDEAVLVDGGYCPETGNIVVSRGKDGKKVWHAYPGHRELMRDVMREGAVDVQFRDGREIRRFHKSKHNPGCLSFEDRMVGK